MLALWEAKNNTPKGGPKVRRQATSGTDSASWVSPHARDRFESSVATARYTAEEYVDGVLVQREMRSTPEGLAWLMSGL